MLRYIRCLNRAGDRRNEASHPRPPWLTLERALTDQTLSSQVADRLYPPERLAELEKHRPLRYTPASASTDPTATPTDPALATDDLTLDAPSPAPDSPSSDEDESIEASIARELAALKSAKGRGPKPKKPRTVGPDGQPGPKPPKPRFQSLETKTECLVFIAVGFPYDPLELANAIVEEVRETGNAKTR